MWFPKHSIKGHWLDKKLNNIPTYLLENWKMKIKPSIIFLKI